MRITDLRPEAAATVAAVRAALTVVSERRRATTITQKDGAFDFATGTDVDSQDAIREVLSAAHPDHAFVGEESGRDVAPSDRTHWLVDPICGTRNFASRIPLYAVNVALVADRRVVVGAVGDGATGDVWIAERDRGAWSVKDGALTKVVVDPTSTVILLDPGRPGGPAAELAAATITAVIRSAQWELRILGTSLDLAYLATGRLAAVRHFSRIPPLHFAAGTLLAAEAGATVSDGEGRPWTIDSEGLLAAATPGIRDTLLGIERGEGRVPREL